MLQVSATIEKFAEKGEKTGWTYVHIPQQWADYLKPGMKKSFRVKGKIDELSVEHLALIPMGEGDFIIPLKADLRKRLRKQKGATLQLLLEVDERPLPLSADFLACLEDEPAALDYFQSLPASHQRYYSKWIEDAKSEVTKSNRIAKAIKGLQAKMDFGSMTKLR